MSRPSGIVTLIALYFAAFFMFQTPAAGDPVVDFPFMVVCKNSNTERFFYLAKIGSDGVAVYISPDNLVGTITLGGTAKPVGGEGAGSCAGKTLEQLRAAGQAFDLH